MYIPNVHVGQVMQIFYSETSFQLCFLCMWSRSWWYFPQEIVAKALDSFFLGRKVRSKTSTMPAKANKIFLRLKTVQFDFNLVSFHFWCCNLLLRSLCLISFPSVNVSVESSDVKLNLCCNPYQIAISLSYRWRHKFCFKFSKLLLLLSWTS